MRIRWIAAGAVVASLLGVVVAPSAAQGYGESPYIFGVHDPDGAGAMATRKGWILFTEELGRDPSSTRFSDYRPWANQGYGILVRLNHGYGPAAGGIPHRAHYALFTQRVASFVRNSPGAHIWILGNEMNWDQEWPGYDGYREPTTPELYVELFRQVRSAIKALPGHEGDQVIPGAIGTYGPPVNAAGQLMCDVGQPGCYGFVEYHARILNLLGAGGLDGIALHTYTHGASPSLVADETLMGPPYATRHYHFRAYRDYLASHPSWARSLPVYITETDQVWPWTDANSGWVKSAYREINDWNQGASNQKVRALCLYRFCCDQWNITGKQGVISDFKEAQSNDYRWTSGSGSCINSVAIDHWKGEYFPNVTLAGSPTLVRDDGALFLNMAWGDSGPGGCGIGTDNFSVRWTRTLYFNAGTYRFTAQADDGVRLYVDGVLRIDEWRDQPPTTFTADVALAAGNHVIRLEYYEHAYGATAALSWAQVSDGVPLDAQVLESQSVVPSGLAPGETRQVVVRVKNTGTSAWTAADMVRIGAGPGNTLAWSAFSCGGFVNSVTDARAYLCSSVPPGGTTDFTFSVTAPAGVSGVLSVRMVKELVSWFGENQQWTVPVVTNPCLGSAPADHWRGEYFANTSLAGSPSLVRDDGAGDLGFDWGSGGPNACGIGVDNYSARWTKTATFSAATYRFTARVDDGVRIFVDGGLVLDKWMVQAPTTYTADVTLAAGSHTVRVEYFEQGGGAVAQVSWQPVSGGPCQAVVPADHWRGEYWSNMQLSGAPAMVRDDGASFLAFDWSGGSPSTTCGVPADRFSARFTRAATFESATYRFTVRADDGLRLYVDGSLKLDQWKDQPPTAYTVDVPLGAGTHTVRLDYYENAVGAVAAISWDKVTAGGTSASKLSLHTGWGSASLQFVRDARPKLVKLLDNFGGARDVKTASPATIVIGRIYEPDQPQDGDPVQRAQQWLDRHRATIVDNALVDYWEGYNEPAAGTVDQVDWYARMEEARVRLLAGIGRKACIGNFSMGVPDVTNPAVWPAFYRAIDAARQNGGILGLHEYGTPMQQYFDGAAGEGWLCGRYRKVYRQFLTPSGRSLPLAVTETGVDGVAPGGWKNHFTGTQYLDQLRWYDGVLRQDDYVIGATIFTAELGGWDAFDVGPILGPLTDYVEQAR